MKRETLTADQLPIGREGFYMAQLPNFPYGPSLVKWDGRCVRAIGSGEEIVGATNFCELLTADQWQARVGPLQPADERVEALPDERLSMNALVGIVVRSMLDAGFSTEKRNDVMFRIIPFLEEHGKPYCWTTALAPATGPVAQGFREMEISPEAVKQLDEILAAPSTLTIEPKRVPLVDEAETFILDGRRCYIEEVVGWNSWIIHDGNPDDSNWGTQGRVVGTGEWKEKGKVLTSDVCSWPTSAAAVAFLVEKGAVRT